MSAQIDPQFRPDCDDRTRRPGSVLPHRTRGRRPDYQQVRRYINDIEPLVVEHAREHQRRRGAPGCEAALAALAYNTKDRNLPSALRGRHPDAVALTRYLQE